MMQALWKASGAIPSSGVALCMVVLLEAPTMSPSYWACGGSLFMAVLFPPACEA